MADFHIFDLIKLDSSINVIDVGAAMNPQDEEPHQILVDNGVATMTGFEPDKNACDELNSKFEGTDHRFFPYFIGDGKDATFHNLKHPFCSSLYAPNQEILSMFSGLTDNFQVVDTEEVTTKRLDDIFDPGSVDYLKVDVQGAELDVFRGAPKILDETLIIFTEVEFVELYQNQPLFGDILIHLRKRGFMFHCLRGVAKRTFLPMIVRNDINTGLNQAIWGDAWFFREPKTYQFLSTDKLLKLALIAHEVLHSYDLALLILDMLDKRNGSNLSAEYLSRF